MIMRISYRLHDGQWLERDAEIKIYNFFKIIRLQLSKANLSFVAHCYNN